MKAEPIVKTALISRTGIMEYLAGELPGVPAGTPPDAIVRVYRDAAEVFDPVALQSFEHAPLTIGHPPGGVTPENFRAVTQGYTLAPVTKDGNHARVKVSLRSAEVLDAYAKGARQLSAGYRMELVWKSGVTADGEVFDACQRKIRGNHVAIVKAGRAGSARIVDEVKTMDEATKLLIDGLNAQLAAAQTKITALEKERDGLAGKVAGLEAKVLSDEQLAVKVDEGVKAAMADKALRESVIAKAKKCAPKLEVTDGMTVRQIQDAAIKAQRPEIVTEGKSDDHVAGIFDTLGDVAPVKSGTSHKTPTGGKILSFSEARELYGRV